MNGCDPKGACRPRQPTQGLRLAEPVNPGRVARGEAELARGLPADQQATSGA